MVSRSRFETALSCEGPRFACKMTIIERTFDEPKCQLTHNKDSHKCSDCGLVFTGKRKLRDHIRTKHSEGYLVCSQNSPDTDAKPVGRPSLIPQTTTIMLQLTPASSEMSVQCVEHILLSKII